MTTKIAAPTLDFVTYYVTDLDQTSQFFSQVLGFTRVPEEDVPGFHQYVDGGGNGFGIVQANAQTPPAGAINLYYQTPDIAALRTQWLANGAEVSPIVQMPFGKICTVTTADNQTLTALEAPAQ